MKRKYWLVLSLAVVGLVLTAPTVLATAYHTITVDGDMDDWAIDEDMEEDAGYGLYLTWDATSIYLGLTGATLGDDTVQDKSFFVCFDTDQVPGSGALGDGYGNVLFSAGIAPEYCYYFAGGTGWYEWSTWNGTDWTWNGWRDDGTFYNYPGNPAANPGSEFTILRNDIGNPISVAVVAFLTPESPVPGPVEASWPTSNGVGTLPILTDAYLYPNLFYDGVSPDIAVAAQGDHIVINELDNYTEWLELYNPTDTSVDIGDWLLTADVDSLNYTIPTGIVLPPGGYWVYNTSSDMDNGGDVISLYDDGAALVDQVGYGNYGGAPAPSTVWRTMARVPNGTDTDDDARDWNLTTTPTAGTVNNAPPVLLGSSLILNEFDNYPVSGNDVVEIYNPTGDAVTLTDWYLSDGDAVAPIVTAVSVPAGGWLALEETVDWTVSMDFSSYDVGYLFMPDGTRVDQIGWAGEFEDYTFQRICDGDGPNDGYDWPSSGGGVTWFDLPDTLGSTNTPGPVDMAIIKSGPASVSAGELITYVVTYWAVNPAPATTYALTDSLPAEVAYVVSDPPGAYDPLEHEVSWSGAVDCGLPSGVVTITVEVISTTLPGTVITNEVTIDAAGDLTATNDTAELATTVVGVDLSVNKTGPTGPVWPGDTISYTISFDLLGTDPALNMVLTDSFPADFTYTDHHVYPTMNCTPSVASLVCATPTLTQAGWLVLTGTVASSPSGYVLTNTVEITASNDGDGSNNYAEYAHPLVMPIQEIQYVPDPAGDDTSPYAGQYAWVEGVVIAASDVFGTVNTRYYIEDPAGGPWSGLYIYNVGDNPAVTEGDWVLLYGLVAEYSGVTELDITDSAGGIQIVLSSGNPLPAPEVLATSAYTPTGAATAEAYESMLIEFQAATVISDDLGYGEWAFDDGSGEAHADDWSNLLTYVPTNGDLYGFIRGIGNFSYGEYKLVPRYDADIDLDYAVTLIYHDLEQVVPDGVTLHIAGNFNGWSTTDTPMQGDGTDDVYSATITLDTVPYGLDYKFIAGDSWDNGEGDILNTANRQVTISDTTTLDQYRNIYPGYAKLNGPASIVIELGDPTPVITGETWFSDIPFGDSQVLMGQIGYGTDTDFGTWTWVDATFTGRSGNNDVFAGSLVPTVPGVYSYTMMFNGNWVETNPNYVWHPGDLDGVHPTEPFEWNQTGVLTVTIPPEPDLTIDKTVAPKEDIGPGSVVTFTIVLDNSGDGDALGVVMTDVLPVEVDFGGWIEQNGAIQANDTLTWTGNVSVGVQLTFAFTATVGSDASFYGQPVINTAYFVSDNAGSGSDDTGFTIIPGRYHVYLPIVVKND